MLLKCGVRHICPGMILEINLGKSVDGGASASVTEASNLKEVIIPISAEQQSESTYAGYRYYSSEVDAIAEKENVDHEKTVIDRMKHNRALFSSRSILSLWQQK